MADMSRRALLRSAAGVGAGVVAGSSLLAACSGASPNNPAAARAAMPSYIPYTGVTPDYPALPNGTLAGFTHYPANPKPVYQGKPGDGQPVTAITQLNGPPPPALDSNQFWQELNNRVGSPLQIQQVNAGNDFVAKIATIQASGQLPDLMQLSPAIPSLGEFVRAKMLDLAPYLSGDKIQKYPFLANIPTDFWKGCVYNGQLAGVPIPRGAASSRVMFYRADLLAKRGITPEIKSYQDFSDLLSEITDARASRWGLAANPLDYIRQMYSIPNNFYQEPNGSFSSAYEHPRQKDALEAARKLQANGVINPDMAAAPAPQVNQWFLSGIGVFNWGSYTGWPGASGGYTAVQPGTRFGLLQVPGFDGGKGRGWAGNLINNMVSIPASAKNRAETLLAIINWLATPFGSEEHTFTSFGIPGVHYTLDGTNPKPIPGKALELGVGIGYLGSGPYALYNAQDPDFVKTVHDHMSTFMDTAVLDPTQIYYSPTFGSKGGQLYNTMKLAELDVIYGRKPVSAWDDIVRDYLNRGGSAVKTELAKAAQNS